MSALPEDILDSLLGRRAFIPAVVEDLDNPPWDEAPQRILIVRLSGFRDIQKSSSHLVLFAEARRALPRAFVDFSFLPERQERKTLKERGLPWFPGLVSGRPPLDFDLVLVSNAFGLELVNLPYFFSTSHIRFKSSERGETEPVIVMGGSNAASAGAVLFGGGGPDADSFLDGLFLGEGEGAIGDLVRILAERGLPRGERLRKAAAIDGFWRSGSGVPARRRVVRPMPPPLVAYPVLNSDEAGTARLQITAGCPGFCSFCLEGWDRRPYREASLPSLLSAARELKRRSGADTLELFSFNFNTHARIYALLFELNRIFRRVNLMSQRLDLLARERPLMRAELAADKRSFTLGVEGISARMRRYFRKGLDDGDLDTVLGTIFARGVREIKLFFIVAGIEEAEDLAEFALFTRKLQAMRESGSPGVRIIVSVGYLVRLPFTPLQFAPLALEESELAPISSAVRSSCEENGIEFRLAVDFDDYLADQLLALGGSSLADWLLAAPSRNFVYDGTLPRAAAESLAEYARDRGLLGARFVNEKEGAWRPPLAFAEEDSRHELLYAHYLEARSFRDRALCLGSSCSDCGACDEPEDRAFLVGHRIEESAADFPERLGRLLAAKLSFARIVARMDIPRSLLGATDSYRSAWLMRRLAAAVPGAEGAVFEVRELLFSGGGLAGMPSSHYGLCVFALFGPEQDALRKAATAAGLEVLDSPPEPSVVDVEVALPPPHGAGAYEALRSWLSEECVEVVERNLGGRRILEPSRRDIKKHIIQRVEILDDARGAFASRLSLGRKARLSSWLDRLGAKAARSVSIRVVGYRD